MQSTTKPENPSTGSDLEALEGRSITRPPQTRSGEEPGERTAPPSSNTGVQTALIDWVGVTFHAQTPEEVQGLFAGDAWISLPGGRNGYRSGWANGHIRIYADGSAGMGVNVQMSGQGCRQLEASGKVEDWAKWFASMMSPDIHFTRIDVAIDERGGLLDMDELRGMVESGRVVSRYKQARPNWSHDLKTGECTGRTLYFGSNSSATKIRIYDKRLEQKLPADSGHWVRCELEARNDQADLVAKALTQGDALEIVAAIVAGRLDFKEEGTHSQRERWDSCAAWQTFLAGVEKMTLSLEPVVKTVQEVRGWIFRQVAANLALVFEAAHGDMQLLFDLLETGKRRYKPKHKAMLALALSS